VHRQMMMNANVIIAINAWKSNPELYRLDDPSLYDDSGNIKSASSWTEKHMNALHIIPIFDINIFADGVLPTDEELNKFKLLWVMSRDDIYDGNWNSFYQLVPSNPSTLYISSMTSILNSLIELVERRRSTDSDLSSSRIAESSQVECNETREQKKTINNFSQPLLCDSGLGLESITQKASFSSLIPPFESSDEGYKLEMFTQTLSNVICSSFLKMTGFHTNPRTKRKGLEKISDQSLSASSLRVPLHSKAQYPSWDYTNYPYTISLLRSMTGSVRPDGVIVYKTNKTNMISHVWIEAKTLETRNSTKYKSTIPQKAAECLALAQSQWDPNITKDCEIFGIEFSHRFVSYWHAVIPYNYLVSLQTSIIIPHDQYVIMERSTVLDLIESEDRRTFARWFLGLLKMLDEG
jgi:hypothetical protein